MGKSVSLSDFSPLGAGMGHKGRDLGLVGYYWHIALLTIPAAYCRTANISIQRMFGNDARFDWVLREYRLPTNSVGFVSYLCYPRSTLDLTNPQNFHVMKFSCCTVFKACPTRKKGLNLLSMKEKKICLDHQPLKILCVPTTMFMNMHWMTKYLEFVCFVYV